MKSEQIRDLALTIIEDMKGIDVVTLDVKTLTDIADYMIICTGRSSRQVKAIAEEVAVQAKHHKVGTVRVEGAKEAEWVLVDLGDVIVHVMLAATRSFYSLEDLWVPVKDLRDQQQSS